MEALDSEAGDVLRKSILDHIREGGYDPKHGRPLPIELIYESNTITHTEYQAEVDRQRRLSQADRNAAAISAMEAEAEALLERTRRAGVPERYEDAPLDKTHAKALEEGGVYIHGSQGSWKTRIACSCLKGWLSDNPFGVALFERATTITNSIMDTYGTRETSNEVMARYASVGLLVVDDLGKEVTSERTVSILWELFDRRYGAMVPTIVTTQYGPDDLTKRLSESGQADTAAAIVSRFRQQFEVVDMGGRDKR